MNLTSEQQEVICSDEKIVLVNAMAGTGKTSTLIRFCEAKKTNNSTFAYFTFNASMAKEAKKSFAKIGKNMLYVGTIHSYALKNIKNSDYYRERIKDGRKLRSIHLAEILEIEDERILFLLLKVFRGFLSSDQDFLHFALEKTLNEEEVEFLENFFGSEIKIREAIQAVWDATHRDNNLPYEHDFYLKKFQMENPKIHADYILIDESQDLNPAMLSILRKQDAKMVFVGDSYQQIYSFRGCVNALDLLKSNNGAKTFFLTKTFRCPQDIVKKAVPYLSLLGVGKERMLNGVERNKLSVSEETKEKPVIICRTNAGILDYLIQNSDKSPSFVGGIASYDFKKINEIALCLSSNENAKNYIKDDLLRSFKNKEAMWEYLSKNDDIELKSRLNLFFKFLSLEIDPFEFIDGLKDFEKKADVLLTTAHRSKGLEWDSVELYDDFPKIKNLVEVNFEELNLLYVAITRAKKQLFLADDYNISDQELMELKKKIKVVR